ncbi:MAG TPA: helix-turn-helix domain-containing protein [Candidatus Polarisedimenticolaceae bacterium]|nr:helix-turn-helix domain-containing protein [Candidatus Polarisedimenticolaceae bacterium]
MTASAAPERLAFRLDELSGMLGVPKSTLHDWTRNGTLGCHRVGKGKRHVILVTREQLDEFLERTRSKATRSK